MITTIQLHQDAKKALDRMKDKEKETYEDVILSMIKELEEKKRKNRELLIEGYKKRAKESLRITKEFESLEKDLDWKW